MTNERIAELDRLATGAIAECLAYGQPDNSVLGFWKGVKMVVDELKRDIKTPQETGQCMDKLAGISKTVLRDTPVYGSGQGRNAQ